MRHPARRHTALLAALAFACVAFGCRRQHAADLPYRTGTVEFHRNGSFRKGRLSAPTRVDSMPCKRWVHRYDTGVLRGAQLAETARVAGHDLPGGSFLWFDEDGRLESAWLSEDTVIDGHACKGGAGKVATGFYPNGAVRAYFLRTDREVDGYLCDASAFHPVRLHPDGTLASCRLAAPATIDGVRFERGVVLTIDPEGVPRRAE